MKLKKRDLKILIERYLKEATADILRDPVTGPQVARDIGESSNFDYVADFAALGITDLSDGLEEVILSCLEYVEETADFTYKQFLLFVENYKFILAGPQRVLLFKALWDNYVESDYNFIGAEKATIEQVSEFILTMIEAELTFYGIAGVWSWLTATKYPYVMATITLMVEKIVQGTIPDEVGLAIEILVNDAIAATPGVNMSKSTNTSEAPPEGASGAESTSSNEPSFLEKTKAFFNELFGDDIDEMPPGDLQSFDSASFDWGLIWSYWHIILITLIITYWYFIKSKGKSLELTAKAGNLTKSAKRAGSAAVNNTTSGKKMISSLRQRSWGSKTLALLRNKAFRLEPPKLDDFVTLDPISLQKLENKKFHKIVSGHQENISRLQTARKRYVMNSKLVIDRSEETLENFINLVDSKAGSASSELRERAEDLYGQGAKIKGVSSDGQSFEIVSFKKSKLPDGEKVIEFIIDPPLEPIDLGIDLPELNQMPISKFSINKNKVFDPSSVDQFGINKDYQQLEELAAVLDDTNFKMLIDIFQTIP